MAARTSYVSRDFKHAGVNIYAMYHTTTLVLAPLNQNTYNRYDLKFRTF